MPGRVIAERPDPDVLRLRLSQPGKKNAIDAALRDDLASQLDAALADPGVRAIVLAGEGGTFSTGGDLQGLLATPRSGLRARLETGHRLIRLVHAAEKPVVAAVDGVAAGGGAALALCADRIVMAEDARFAFTFLRIGFVPDWGIPYTLAMRVGRAQARRILLDCEAVDAVRAAALGLADAVVPAAGLEDAALAQARVLARMAPQAYGLTKRLMQSLPATLDGALEAELAAQTICFGGEEFREGVDAFLSKRPPSF